MSTSLISCIQSTPYGILSSTTDRSTTTASTSVTAYGGSGTYTYVWTFTGTTCTITNGTTVTPTFTYSAAGTTSAYCTISDTNRKISFTSPKFIITWTIPITAISFLLNGSFFTTNQNRGSGTTYTITGNITTPANATYTPTSQAQSTDGVYSLTCTGTGSYSGSVTSSTLTITTASITQGTPTASNSTPASAGLSSGVTATAWTWSRVSGTTCTFSPSNTANVNITAPISTPTGATSVVQCIVSFTGGTSTATQTIIWGLLV